MRCVNSPLDIRFEDAHLLVVNKPAGVLSQPGKTVDGSIATQILNAYPEADGPMLVHRLDMDTSGLMIFAKSKTAHRDLQQQFEHRKITKRYVAILSRSPLGIGGQILLPLRPDIDNRPVQIVCHEHGKNAATIWRYAQKNADQFEKGFRVVFTPITGRTHQLRVHASHCSGLNAPIVGDRLYGDVGERLMLHAERIGFRHPVSGAPIVIQSDAPF